MINIYHRSREDHEWESYNQVSSTMQDTENWLRGIYTWEIENDMVRMDIYWKLEEDGITRYIMLAPDEDMMAWKLRS